MAAEKTLYLAYRPNAKGNDGHACKADADGHFVPAFHGPILTADGADGHGFFFDTNFGYVFCRESTRIEAADLIPRAARQQRK